MPCPLGLCSARVTEFTLFPLTSSMIPIKFKKIGSVVFKKFEGLIVYTRCEKPDGNQLQ